MVDTKNLNPTPVAPAGGDPAHVMRSALKRAWVPSARDHKV
ncbi:hypothetical protein COXBURSA331_A1571 [Coxiella burnetii RSA 331]|nr:hypothetical protein COXBURSA331_A1571 [Coxiella burnetii RSA 331]